MKVPVRRRTIVNRYSTVLTVPVLTCQLRSLRSYFTEDNFFFFFLLVFWNFETVILSLADFHFAAMSGLLLLNENYAGRVVDQQTKQTMIQVAASMTKEAGTIKASPSGLFACRMYEKYRLQ